MLESKWVSLNEGLREDQPRFSLRPLWIESHQVLALGKGGTLVLPSWFEDLPTLAFFCKRAIEWGYNAFVFGSKEELPEKNEPPSELNFFIKTVQSYGLKIYFKPNCFQLKREGLCSPVDEKYKERLQGMLQEVVHLKCDGIFWESCYLNSHFTQHPLAEDKTFFELLIQEVELLSALIKHPQQLIYYLPTDPLQWEEESAKWLLRLYQEVRYPVIFAFSAVAGDPVQDHLSPHRLWRFLDQEQHHSSRALLLPLVNVGMIQRGEGRWPLLSLKKLDQVVDQMHPRAFIGCMGLVNTLPEIDEWLSCSLFTLAEKLRCQHPSLQLAERWFLAHLPSWDFAHCQRYATLFYEWLEEYLFSKEQFSAMKELGQEKMRLDLEALASWLNRLYTHALRSYHQAPFSKSYEDSVKLFVKEARRLILQAAQDVGILMPHLTVQDY